MHGILCLCRPRMPTNLSACIALTGEGFGEQAQFAVCGDETQSSVADWSQPEATVMQVGCWGALGCLALPAG